MKTFLIEATEEGVFTGTVFVGQRPANHFLHKVAVASENGAVGNYACAVEEEANQVIALVNS